jgi:hypothetical protein
MLHLLVFAEDDRPVRFARGVGDRVMVEDGPDWVDAELLDALRRWQGLAPGLAYTKWTALKRAQAGRRRPRYLGRRPEGDRGSDYAIGVVALLEAAQVEVGAGDTRAVLLLRDADSTRDRRAGLRQVAAESRFGHLNVIVGIADKMSEAWLLAGWQPRDATEQALLAACCAELGFNPTREPHRLRGPRTGDARHPKAVLERLIGADLDREAACWQEPTLAALCSNGTAAGVADLIEQLRRRLPPLLGGIG